MRTSTHIGTLSASKTMRICHKYWPKLFKNCKVFIAICELFIEFTVITDFIVAMLYNRFKCTTYYGRCNFKGLGFDSGTPPQEVIL